MIVLRHQGQKVLLYKKTKHYQIKLIMMMMMILKLSMTRVAEKMKNLLMKTKTIHSVKHKDFFRTITNLGMMKKIYLITILEKMKIQMMKMMTSPLAINQSLKQEEKVVLMKKTMMIQMGFNLNCNFDILFLNDLIVALF